MEILAEIRKRNRQEWEHLAKEKWTDTRLWIQENGEVAAVSALVSGIIIVLCFKLIFYMALIAAIAAFGVWYLAYPGEASRPAKDSNDPEIPPTQH